MSNINDRIKNIEKRINRLTKLIGISDIDKEELPIIDNINKIEELKVKLLEKSTYFKTYLNLCEEFKFDLKNFNDIENLNLLELCILALNYNNDIEEFQNNFNNFKHNFDYLNNELDLKNNSWANDKLEIALSNLNFFNNSYNNFEKDFEQFIIDYSNTTMFINEKMIERAK